MYMYVYIYIYIYVCMYVYIHKYKITIHSHRPRYVGQLTFQRTLGRALLATSTSVLECQAQTSSVGSPSTTSIDHLGQTRHFFDRGRTHVATCQRHWAAMVTLSRSVTVVVAWSKLLMCTPCANASILHRWHHPKCRVEALPEHN